ncbi:MAG TPA: ATP-binding cassette domain-containing protein, partial [Acidimicrobiia bacterium]
MTLDMNGSDVSYAARAVKVSKIYGEGDAAVRALDSVTDGFPSGRFTAIMGPSGSGKSTLMHCQAGLDSVTSGNDYLGQT